MLNKSEMTYIVACCVRAEKMDIAYDDRLSMLMDLEYAGIDAERLLSFPDLDFIHDIGGLNKYFDRESKTFKQFFMPRCTRIPNNKDGAK